MAEYYTIPVDKIEEASAFEIFQMKKYGNCIVLQGGYSFTRQDKREQEERRYEQKSLIEHERLTVQSR